MTSAVPENAYVRSQKFPLFRLLLGEPKDNVRWPVTSRWEVHAAEEGLEALAYSSPKKSG